MKIGICSANGGVCAAPDVLSHVAEHAEGVGVESLWVSEHHVLADPRIPPSSMEPGDPILDPIVALAYVAARTTTLRLGTGVVVVPLRNPLILAKELATLDVVSGGRLLFGIGVGYAPREFAALGVPLEGRGKRADEYLDAILAVWSQAHPSYDGELFSFDGVGASPQPTQRHPPIVVGGSSLPALRRAAARGNGWYGWGMDLAETERALERLRQVLARTPRIPALGDLEVTVTPTGKVDVEVAHRYAGLGVDRLNLPVRGSEERDVLGYIDGPVARIAAAVARG
jgi:probable F420-dependent oxidoreductase